MDLPDPTTKRLRDAHEDLALAQERWNELMETVCEIADVDVQSASIDLKNGIVKTPEDEGETDEEPQNNEVAETDEGKQE